MCRMVSFLNSGNVSGLQNLSLLRAKSQVEVAENNKSLPENNDSDIDIKKLANSIRAYNDQSKLPTFKEIEEKFNNGELNPKNLKKGDEIILNLGGKNYKFKIEKDGEFSCKVRGRDDSVRIYQCKNKFGQDCICLEHHYKKTEANFYVTYKRRIPIQDYDKKIKK